MDSYKNDIEIVANSYDIVEGQNPNKSEIKVEDAKRKDNKGLNIEVNQGILEITAKEWNSEQELAQVATYDNVQKIKAKIEHRKTDYANKIKSEMNRTEIGR